MHITTFSLISMIICLAALFGYVNERLFKIPTTIAIMSGSLLTAFIIMMAGQFGFAPFHESITKLISNLDFHKLLMQGLLSFLLFAGSLTIDLQQLKKQRNEILILALFSTLLSTVLIGFSVFYLLKLLHTQIPLLYCLLFGALISPTDPIAVLSIFKKIGAPKRLEICVSGESLFNDGIGIVMFLTLYHFAFAGEAPTWQGVTLLFLHQTAGGICFGIALGYIALYALRSISNYKVEVLITLAVASGGYTLANQLGVSGPLAMVVSGIFIGNRQRRVRVNRSLHQSIDNFWEIIDEILNAILFLLIGFELLVIKPSHYDFLISLIVIPLVLLIRYITVAIPIRFIKEWRRASKQYISVLVWGGLRGGLAVALALSLPKEMLGRDLIITMTYSVVVFAVIVQGLTVKPLVKKVCATTP